MKLLDRNSMGKVTKSDGRWCWSMLVANKPPIYNVESQFWQQKLCCRASGKSEQFENGTKNYLILCKALIRSIKALESVFKFKMRFV